MRCVPNRRGRALFGVGGWGPYMEEGCRCARAHELLRMQPRTYRNQEFHDQLTHGDAESVFREPTSPAELGLQG